MNKDTASSTMFEDVVTMIRILSLIPQDRWTTVAEIHQELEDRGVEIHRRTLQRYLKTIRDHSDVFPIHVETSGKPYGFCWDPQSAGFHLPQLGVEQMLLLRIAEERLQSHLPPQAITPIRPLLRSARRVIKYDDETEGTWLRKVKVLEDAQPSSRRSFVPAFYLPLLTRSSSITKFCCAAVRRAAAIPKLSCARSPLSKRACAPTSSTKPMPATFST